MEGQKRIRPANIVRREITLCKIFEDEFIRSNLPRTNQNLAKIALIMVEKKYCNSLVALEIFNKYKI